MISNYTRPQLLVKQIRERIVTQEPRTIHAFAFGPQFDLFRYTNEDERANMAGVDFVENTDPDPDARQLVPYEGLLPKHIVDETFVKLYGENLEGRYWNASSQVQNDDATLYNFEIPSLLYPNKLRVIRRGAVVTATITGNAVTGATLIFGGSGYTASSFFDLAVPGGTGGAIRCTTNSSGVVSSVAVLAAGSGYTNGTSDPIYGAQAGANIGEVDDLIAELYGRPVKVGDVLYATVNGETTRRVIRKIERDTIASHFGTNADANDLKFAASSNNPAQTSASFGSTSAPSGWAIALRSGSAAGDWNGLAEGAKYDGKYGDRYTITVIKGGDETTAKVRIRSASGVFSAESVGVDLEADDFVINAGGEVAALGGLRLKITPPDPGDPLVFGDVFAFTIFGAYTPLNLSAGGTISSIAITAAGTGYTNGTHQLVITAPPVGGTQATGTATISGGSVTAVNITNAGAGYVYTPVVTLPGGAGAGTGAVLTATLVTASGARDLLAVQTGVYTGTRDTTYQVKVTRGINNQAIAYATITGGAVASIEIEAGGGGYTAAPSVALPAGAGAGSNAAMTAVLTNGVVSSITIGNAGSGYTNGVHRLVIGSPANSFIGAEVEVSDTNGVDVILNYTLDHAVEYNLGSYGLKFILPGSITTPSQSGLRTGDLYYIKAVAEAATGPLSTVVTNGQLTDISNWVDADLTLNRFNADFRAIYSGVITAKRNDAPELAYEVGDAADGGILVRHQLQLQLTDRDEDFQWVDVKNSDSAKLFAHWRGLVPANSADTVKLYSSESSIIAAFGADDEDNPVCHSAIIAMRGGQGKAVYVGKVATDDVAGYSKLLAQAERIDGAFSLAPATLDTDIIALCKSHVLKMSAEDTKLWRRLYCATQNPGKYAVMTEDADDQPFNATITASGSGSNYIRVICPDGDFITRKIQPGYVLRTNYSYDEWNEPVYEEYEIATVLEQDELLLVSGPSAAVNPAQKFEIWATDTGLSQATYVGNASAAFNDSRVINCWVDDPLTITATSEIKHSKNFYVAAEIAGLRAALLPQQGLTYTELDHSLSAAPLMFTKYTNEDLNVAAAKGTLIVTQEVEDGPIFIRHQLTTDASNGPLYYEDSVGTNLDFISYVVKDVFQPYIGKRNATPETLEELETKMRDILDTFKKDPGGFTQIGPALISYAGLKVSINEVFKDRIDMEVTLELPLPINTLTVTLKATHINDTVTIEILRQQDAAL